MVARLLRPLLVLVALATGCGPSLDVEVLQPARVNLGAGRRLTLVQTEGLQSARGQVTDAFMRQTREEGFFQPSNRSNEGIVVKVTGSTVVVYSSGNGPAQAVDEIGLRMDVLNWDALRETRIVTETAPDGSTIQKEESRYNADVVVAITAFNIHGQALLAEHEYHTGATAPTSEEALKAAADEAIHQFLEDVTPTVKRQHLRFDDTDSKQEPIIELAQAGDLALAIEEMRAYAQAHPELASAHYNLAVLLDASGQYEAALDSYSRAISMHPSKDMYVDAKVECSRRLSDWQALTRP